MPENAAKAKSAFEKRQATTHIAAVFEDSDNEDYFEECEERGEGDEYVPHPFDFPEHLQWTCCIDAPFTCAPTPISALIDHGSPPVLISSSLIEILGLVPKPLFKPLSVSAAFTKEKRKPDSRLLLSQYCRLNIQLPDSVWKSKAINAVIFPELHTDLILGLDFLCKNRIVVDAHLRTAVDKSTSYDLLNPPDPAQYKKHPITSPHLRRKTERQLIRTGQERCRKVRNLVHIELKTLFDENPERFDMDAYTTGPPCVIAAVQMRIKELASMAELLHLDNAFKTKYKDHFPTDIPHIRDLPTDVYHHIELRPGSPVSVARAYGCPRKYRTGWKTLIEQHLAAGRIRPSSSPYASPSFIIPKADITVLPRWVNDYRHLNRLTIPDNYPLPRIDDILADCAKGKIWGKIDMTNSFFQTLVHPDHVKYTATLTPFGLWEWVVMPMGL